MLMFRSHHKSRQGLASTLVCSLLVAGLGFVAPAAFAAGGDQSGGTGANAGSPPGADKMANPGMKKTDLTTCPPGQVWNKKTHKCLERHSSVLPDADLTEYAYALAKADRYEEAIDVLDLLENGNTPRALNYRGYATRKLGRTEEGIVYYLKSVALDPNYAQVREYLGEAYVVKGDVPRAEQQLRAIKKICGVTCPQYQELAVAIADPVGWR